MAKQKKKKKQAPVETPKVEAVEPMGKEKGDDGLTYKQRQFIAEYLVDLNATQAAIRAGYSKKTAGAIATENLTKPLISKAIQKALRERLDRTKMKADEVLLELGAIARSDILDYVNFGPGGVAVRDSSELTEGQSKALSSVAETFSQDGRSQFKFRTHDKIKALDLLAKHMKLYEEPTINVNIETHDLSKLTDKQLAQLADLVSATTPGDDKS